MPLAARDHDYGALLDAVRHLKWRARRASRAAVPGIHASRVRGTSAEFTEYRSYRQGDDLRRVDWKLFARTDRAHVRISEERAITPTMIVLDASASMAFPAVSYDKWRVAQQIAVALTAIAHATGDPVGILLSPHDGRSLAPRTRRGIVAEAAKLVDACVPHGSAALSAALATAMRTSARVAIVSDFLGDTDELLSNARAALAAGHDIQAIHVIARDELEPPRILSAVVDPEADGAVRTLDDATRRDYARAFSSWRDAMREAWLGSGAAYRTVIAGAEPVEHAVRRIVDSDAAAA